MATDVQFSPAYPAAKRPPACPRITDHEGRLLLVEPLGMTEFTHRRDQRIVPAIRARIVVLDGPDAPLVLDEVVIPQGVLVRTLQKRLDAGQPPLLARLVSTAHRKDPRASVWVFRDPTPEDEQLAARLMQGGPTGGR